MLGMNLGEDKRVRVWDLAAGMMLVELKGHTDTVVGLSWSRDSECLASCGLDGAVRVWNVHSHSSSLSRWGASPVYGNQLTFTNTVTAESVTDSVVNGHRRAFQ
jgi:WD40 repeat protein